MISHGDLEMPSVTICSLFPFTATSLFNASLKISKESRFHKYVSLRNQLGYIAKKVDREDVYLDFRNRLNSYASVFENSDEEMEKYTHDLDSLLARCSWREKPCDTSFFITSVNGNYQKCFTFNGHGLNLSNMIVEEANPINGLSMVIFLDAFKFNQQVLPNEMVYNPENPNSGTTGLHVTIHPPQSLPFPIVEGFDVPPGYSTTIGLTTHARKRLAEPYGSCTNREFLDGTNLGYSHLGCLEQCQQKEIMHQCGCVSAFLLMPNDAKDLQLCGRLNLDNLMLQDPNVTIIDKDFAKLKCEKHLLKMKLHPETNKRCKCKHPCYEIRYEQTISNAYWPFEYIQQQFLENMFGSSDTKSKRSHVLFDEILGNVSDAREAVIESGVIRKNFLRLNIYFKDLTIETTEQTKEYTGDALMSDIGGTLGFYIGMSIITMCEALNLTWKLILALWRKCRSSEKTVEPPSRARDTDVKE
ncbi:unnamed protein product [Owenia fusiformis]|uniref:Uncharacterized protein n=1 Tax=Owenia fusiformis TaxID=6347 RepID=A0A8S4PYW7_OWEFU|nr:unnamed protein product [Owenia fusiformis]